MESNTNAQDYKKKLDNYEISQNEIPNEIKQEIANLYVNEIEKTRKHIKDLNSQIESYQKKIEMLKKRE